MRLENVPISNVRVYNVPLDAERAAKVTGAGQIGSTVLRLSDQSISHKSLKGLSVRVVKSKSESAWDLKGVSIVGVVTQAGQISPLYRSYLISPKYFSVINQVLSKMIFDAKYEKSLTSYIMQFLTKLIKSDYQFASLILDTIDLRSFINMNLLTKDQSHIQTASEFLRCFQSEPAFVKNLYEILIDIIETELPYNVPSQRGYEALIGMLTWVMPFDTEKTLRVLIDTFYSKVTKVCVQAIQTPEYVEFRTRYTAMLSLDSEVNYSEHYPFDEVLLRPLSLEESSNSGENSQDKTTEGEDG
jgi:hypothetical protein